MKWVESNQGIITEKNPQTPQWGKQPHQISVSICCTLNLMLLLCCSGLDRKELMPTGICTVHFGRLAVCSVEDKAGEGTTRCN